MTNNEGDNCTEPSENVAKGGPEFGKTYSTSCI